MHAKGINEYNYFLKFLKNAFVIKIIYKIIQRLNDISPHTGFWCVIESLIYKNVSPGGLKF